jgi:zinc transport system substrate-binding protein
VKSCQENTSSHAINSALFFKDALCIFILNSQSIIQHVYFIMKRLFFICLALLLLPSCAAKHVQSEQKPVVCVSIVPQKYFVDRISGGLFDCQVMVPPGTNIHAFEPKPQQMSLLASAKAYFAIGLEFETPWLPRFCAVAPHMRIVHSDSGIQKLASTDHDEESTVTSQNKQHRGDDPHIWLSPRLVRKQATLIASALCAIDSVHTQTYAANLTSFVNELDSLDAQLHSILPCDTAANTRRAFLVFHPTWGYFAQDYCLSQIAIEVQGKEPGPRTMKTILDTAHAYKIKTVFVQPEYSRKTSEVIARELGASLVDADALAYDWKNNLISVAKSIAAQQTPANNK